MKYFHEITNGEKKALYNGTKTYGQLMEEYKQPDWCDYPEALNGLMGCWSLITYPERINKKYCSDCESCKK